MTQDQKIQLMGRLISGRDINKELSKRRIAYEYASVSISRPSLIEEMIAEGWESEKTFKTTIRLRKTKPVDVRCEDALWTMLALMGFKVMNKDRHLQLPYDEKRNLTQQIDVFAKDDETVLIAECKSAERMKTSDFKKTLEATSGQIEGLIKSIKSLFPDENLKFKYILATTNYELGDQDKERLRNLNGVHLEEEAVEYYTSLYKHLGAAARYQLLGALFHGQDIPGMDNVVPAIRGKMGNHEYFSFSIEPEKLLKIGYVLHRSKVNSELMPTYQRLVKKGRINQILNFIDNKAGYFPNSIVISLDTGGRELQFDRANTQVKSTVSSLGVLHLPKQYRSAYVIDGQHRLYGYANSKYKATNTVPVVAFLNLERDEQVKLFMDINENQKAVPKNLRTTLNADLLWASDDFKDQYKALCSRIALGLGEKKRSPLFNLISIGEDKKQISADFITRALMDGNFIGKVNKKSFEKLGTFYKGNLEQSYEDILHYLVGCFADLRDGVGESLWLDKESILITNKGVYSLIVILSDIIDHLISIGAIDEKSPGKLKVDESRKYIDVLIDFYLNLDEELAGEIRRKYGQSGETFYWRTLQKAVREKYTKFTPPGLDEYEKKESKEYNEEAFKSIRDIEQRLNIIFKQLLMENYGDGWFEEGVPAQIQDDAVKLAQQKKRESRKPIEPWDCLRIIDYRTVALRSGNWQSIFENVLTRPEEQNISGGKEAKTQWMNEAGRIRNQIMHSYYVSKEDLEFLIKIKTFVYQ
jgi:DNA sulfur modification protein DndB